MLPLPCRHGARGLGGGAAAPSDLTSKPNTVLGVQGLESRPPAATLRRSAGKTGKHLSKECKNPAIGSPIKHQEYLLSRSVYGFRVWGK